MPMFLCTEESTRSWRDGPAAYSLTHECIQYDEGQMSQIRARYGDTTVIGIWIHEIGHMLQHKTYGNAMYFMHDFNPQQLELEADRIAGCGLGRLGLSPEPLIEWLKDVNGNEETHGTIEQRAMSIRLGYDKCSVPNKLPTGD